MFDHAQSARLGQRTPVENPGVQLVTAATLPEVAYRGQIVYLLDEDVFRVYDGVAWQNPTSSVVAGTQTFVGPDTPAADAVGDLWMNDTTFQLSVWDGFQWRSAVDPRVTQVQQDLSVAAGNAQQALNAQTGFNTALAGKNTTYYLPTQPAAPNYSPIAGDLWINTVTNRLYRFSSPTAVTEIVDSQIVDAWNKAGIAKDIADAKISTWYTKPLNLGPLDDGDLWFDAANGNQLNRWNGSGWVLVQDTAIGAAATAATNAYNRASDALTAAQIAKAVADGAISTYYSATPPWANNSVQDDAKLGDLWFNTSTNQASRWNGTFWALIADNQINLALQKAQDAQTTADGKITAYYLIAPPWPAGATGHSLDQGDIWYDITPASKNKPYYWDDGSKTWIAVRDLTIADAQDTANAKAKITYATAPPWANNAAGHALDQGDIWYDTTLINGTPAFKPYYWNDPTKTWTASPDATIAVAQTTANSKTTTFYGANQPVGVTQGDLWVNTANSNEMKRWDGSSQLAGSWITVRDATIATAQTTANFKTSTFYSDTSPNAPAGIGFTVGDIWVNTTPVGAGDGTASTVPGNLMNYWTGTKWTPLPVTSASIGTSQVNQDHLVNVLDLTSTMITSRSLDSSGNPTGPGVDMTGTGLYGYDANGNLAMRITNDPTNQGANKFVGDAEIDHLTVQTLTTLLATQLSQGAVFSMQLSVAAPIQPPSVVIGYQTNKFTDDGLWADRRGGITTDGTNYYTVRRTATQDWYLEKWSSAGALTKSVLFNGTSSTYEIPYGLAWDGTSVCVLQWVSSLSLYTIDRWNSALTTIVDSTILTGTTAQKPEPISSNNDPNLAYDFATGDLIIGQSRATNTGRVRFARLKISGTPGNTTPAWGTTLDSTNSYSQSLGFLLYGAFDLGTAKYVYGTYGLSATQATNTDGSQDTTVGWAHGSVYNRRGMVWSGLGTITGSFQMFDSSGTRYTYETGLGNRWTSSSDSLWFMAYSWTNGASETITSPAWSFTMNKRARATISVPAYPAGVNGANIYLAKGSAATPSASTSSTTLQGATSGTTRSRLITNAVFTPFNNLLTPAGFTGTGTPSAIVSTESTSNPRVNLKGDGSGRVGPLSWDSTGATLTQPSDATKVDTSALLFGRKTAATTNSTTSPTASGLTANLAVGTYTFLVRGQYQCAATTTGIGMRISGTAVESAMFAEAVIYGGANSSSSPVFTRTISAMNQAAGNTTGVQTAATPTPFRIEGFIIVTTAGTFAMDFQSQAAGSAVQINAGSSIQCTKVA